MAAHGRVESRSLRHGISVVTLTLLLLSLVGLSGSVTGEAVESHVGATGAVPASARSSSSLSEGEDLYLLTMDSSFHVVHTSGEPPQESTYDMRAVSTVYLPPPDASSVSDQREGAGYIELTGFHGVVGGEPIQCTAQGSMGTLKARGRIGPSSIHGLRLRPSASGSLSCSLLNYPGQNYPLPNLWAASLYAMHRDEMDELALTDGMLVEGWTMGSVGDVFARKVYARQKAFDDGETQQHVTENTVLEILRLPPLPEVSNVHAMGYHTPGDRPETGREVLLCVDVAPSDDYELRSCVWNGDLPAGQGDPECGCLYQYTPAIGHGPDPDTYGDKDVSLLLTFTHKASGSAVWKIVTGRYKVFFAKHGLDHGHHGDPNWFEYWRDDGAVPGLDAADVEYDPSLQYGRYSSTDEKVYIGAMAPEVHYDPPVEVSQSSICPGGTFGGAEGIDSVAEVLAHERRHEYIDAFWDYPATDSCADPTGLWGGCADSDGDQLPDAYETAVHGTSTSNADSCNLAKEKNKVYADDGDQELDCMLAGDGETGVAENDWANPGKQADAVAVTPCLLSTVPNHLDTDSSADSRVTSGPAAVGGFFRGEVSATSESMASLTDQYAETAIDSDGDNLENQLKLSVGVQVYTAERYKLVTWLEDGAAQSIAWAAAQQNLSLGTHTIDVLFDGTLIWASSLDGPYSIARVELRAGDHEQVLDVAQGVHTTAAYAHTDFDPPAATLSGVFADVTQPLSAESPLLGDLRIRVGLGVHSPGRYTLLGVLSAGDEVVAVGQRSLNLQAGSHDALLTFSRQELFNHRSDGPYTLAIIRLTDDVGSMLDYAADAFTTTIPYTASQFLYGDALVIQDGFSELAVDLDHDRFYDRLDIGFTLVAEAFAPYRVTGTLEDSTGQVIAHGQAYPTERTDAAITGDTDAAETRVLTGTLSFGGDLIRDHGVDGPFALVAMAVVRGDGTQVDYLPEAYTTDAYGCDEFASASTPTPTVTPGTPAPSATPTATEMALTPGPSLTPTGTPSASATPRLHLPILMRRGSTYGLPRR